MTPIQLTRRRVLAVISAEADDEPVERLQSTTRLKGDLNLSGSQRIALCCALEQEFGIRLDDAATDAISSSAATVEAVCLAVLRHTTKGAAQCSPT